MSDEATILAVLAELGLSPGMVERVPGGVSNRVYRVRSGRHDLAFRLSSGRERELLIDRRSEQLAFAAAAAAGLAPPLVAADPRSGWLVSGWCDGDPMPASCSHERSLQVAGFVARLHAIDVPDGVVEVDLAGSVEHYRAALSRPTLPPVDAIALAGARLQASGPHVLCHHDLHSRNLFVTPQGLQAIDWEYAGHGPALNDIASFAAAQALDDDAMLRFAAAAGCKDPRALHVARWLADWVTLAWLDVAATRAGLDAASATLRAELRGWLSLHPPT